MTGPTKITSSMEGIVNPEDFGVSLLSVKIEGGKNN
jgi:anthranilate phosphoribosyltransferase